MKKLIVATILGFAACLGCFAQGNFVFNNSSSSAVWEVNDVNAFKAGPNLYVTVMWSTNLSAVPTTYLNGAATPTNSALQTPNPTGIFTDPNFQLAHSTTAGNPVIVNDCGGTGPAAGIYFGGLQYISGPTVFQTIQLYVLGWYKSYGADPIAAANGGSPVGFSSPIQFTLGDAGNPAGSLGNAGISGFGVGVPEPSTCALVGLGAAALLIYRRRKR